MDVDGSLEAIVTRVNELVADIAGVDASEVAGGVPLFAGDDSVDGLQLDSLDALKLALSIATEYNLDEVADIDYETVRTVRDIAEYVHSLKPPGGAP